MVPKRILPVIVVSQFAGTSLWFAGNAVISDLRQSLGLPVESLGWITSAVQLGFISGTLLFAFLSLADRYSPVKIFMICSLVAAFFNLGTLVASNLPSLLTFRFMTGFFLAGIYPVGMKIAASWYKEGLGKALGWLVGALVLGTAFPHLVRGIEFSPHWQLVIIFVSIVAAIGGLLIYFLVPDGTNTGKASGFKANALGKVFQDKSFRSAAFGYFGHMWELYAFWAFIPVIIVTYSSQHQIDLPVSILSFITIAVGTAGCIIGGIVSQKKGSAKVAFYMLLTSGICCLISLLVFELPLPLFLTFIFIWGFAVVGDSPQFSALTARYAPQEYVATGLTIVNSIGFAITIVSISLISSWIESVDLQFLLLLLLPGPVFGLISIKKLL